MTTLASISSSQVQKEVTANENFIATSPAGLFGRRYAGISGLTWAFYGGILMVDGVATTIANDTVLLTASNTNYIERTRAGVVSANITGFTAGRIPLYTAVTSGSAITSYTDYRDLTTQLQKARVGVTVTTADVTLSAAEARVDEVKATGTLTGNRSLIVPTVAGWWIVDNATAGAFTLTAKTAAGTGPAVPQGYRSLVYCDGTDVKEAVTGFSGAISVGGTLTLAGSAANIALGSNFLSGDGGDEGISVDSSGNVTASGTLAVNGSAITTDDATFAVFNTNATTINAFGAATTLRLGASGGNIGFGTSALGYYGARFAGTITSNGASTVGIGVGVDYALVGAAGDTSYLVTLNVAPPGITTQGASELIGVVASARFAEPIITVGTGDSIPIAATVYIHNAPTEGAVNAACYSAAGNNIFIGNTGIGGGSWGTSAAGVLSMTTGTAPSTGPADTVQFYSSDDAAGHTVPSFYCEGTNVVATGQADSVSSVRVKMRINGTVRTFLCI